MTMNIPFSMLAVMTMMTSTLMAMSSTNWIMLWASMEINLLSFIPMILFTHENQETEASIKYFLAQSIGSSILLMSSMSMWMMFSISDKSLMYMLMFSILLKLGMVPCHMWYPSVMMSMPWASCAILSTWQKLAPLSVLSFILIQKTSNILLYVAALNSIVGGMMGMNQTHLRAILAYSSINHMGWMISMLSINKPLMTMLYFMVYVAVAFPLFVVLALNKLTTVSASMTKSIYALKPHTFIPIMLLNLGGMPPMSGFAAKWLALSELMMVNKLMCYVLIMGSMMALYFYLNMGLSLLSVNISKKWNNCPFTDPKTGFLAAPLNMVLINLTASTMVPGFMLFMV